MHEGIHEAEMSEDDQPSTVPLLEARQSSLLHACCYIASHRHFPEA